MRTQVCASCGQTHSWKEFHDGDLHSDYCYACQAKSRPLTRDFSDHDAEWNEYARRAKEDGLLYGGVCAECLRPFRECGHEPPRIQGSTPRKKLYPNNKGRLPLTQSQYRRYYQET